MSPKPEMPSDDSLERYMQVVLSKKVLDPIILDVRELTSYADTFIICSGRSNRQVAAIADHVHQSLKKQGIKPISVDGKKEGHWVLMDYGDIIIHIFYDSVRRFYDLEGLWMDAPRLTTSSLEKFLNEYANVEIDDE
jgi:ribosome-associated protein